MALTKVSRGLLSTSIVDNGNATAITIDSSENVGIGTSAIMQDFGGGRTTLALKGAGSTDYSTLQLGNYGTSSNGQIHGLINFYDGTTSVSRIQSVRASNTSDAHLAFYTAPSSGGITERMRIDSSGNVGIGISSSLEKFTVANTSSGIVGRFTNNTNQTLDLGVISGSGAAGGVYYNSANSGYHAFQTGGTERMRIDSSGDLNIVNTGQASLNYTTDGSLDYARITGGKSGSGAGDLRFFTYSGGIAERMRIDSSGNLLVGKTASSFGTDGVEIKNDQIWSTNTSSDCISLNRKTSDGAIATFYKDGSSVGSIGTVSGDLTIYSTASGHKGLRFGEGYLIPTDNTGGLTDATADLGLSSYRFKDIYRSGSTYQSSDRTLKQDIRNLTDAERNVAVACKGLLKAFRFIDAVEKDGDDACIHFGVIAQELAEAFAAEGLDANDYQVYKSATTTDEDGNEQTRLNVCYENLLAFIISAI